MKTDLYTKTILSIIAICLTINLAKEIELIPSVHASETPIDFEMATKYKLVQIDEFNTIDVRIVDINTYDELNVNLKTVSYTHLTLPTKESRGS